MRKFKQNKLWRDKAVENMEKSGSKVHWTSLDTKTFAEELKIKLREETEEVCTATTRDAQLSELADVLEVITSFCNVHDATLDDIVALKNKKFQERGGFQGRKYVTMSEHPVGSAGEKYCLADPTKYPEIIE